MVEADLLARAGVPAISYHLLSTHYNLTRTEYYRVLHETSSRPKGNPMAFITYALRGLVDGLRGQLSEIKAQHREVVWRDFVHDSFRDKDTKRYHRLRCVATDLQQVDEPVPKSDFWLISKRVAEAYREKTGKTITRDVNELLERNLIRREQAGFVANVELLEAFVSPARPKPPGERTHTEDEAET